MERKLKYILLVANITLCLLIILISCGGADDKFFSNEERFLGLGYEVDSIVISKHRVTSLDDTLSLKNQDLQQTFCFDNSGYLISENIIGFKKGQQDYSSFTYLSRDKKLRKIKRETTIFDQFENRKMVEVLLKRNITEEVWSTTYFSDSQTNVTDTTKVIYLGDTIRTGKLRNNIFIKEMDEIYESDKLLTKIAYLNVDVFNLTKFTYDDTGKPRTMQTYIHLDNTGQPIPQPKFTYSYLYNDQGHLEQKITVVGGILVSIEEIKNYLRK